jgi:hypothetical protein
MSHIASVAVEIKDLECLAKAAERCGLEFKKDQKNFRWYGRWMDDYADDNAAYKLLGIDPKDYGKCEHALSVKDDKSHSCYEIGVVNNPKGGYALLWDFFSGGLGLMKHVSSDQDEKKEGIGKLMKAYSVEVAKKAAKKQGFMVQETVQSDGSVKLRLSR